MKTTSEETGEEDRDLPTHELLCVHECLLSNGVLGRYTLVCHEELNALVFTDPFNWILGLDDLRVNKGLTHAHVIAPVWVGGVRVSGCAKLCQHMSILEHGSAKLLLDLLDQHLLDQHGDASGKLIRGTDLRQLGRARAVRRLAVLRGKDSCDVENMLRQHKTHNAYESSGTQP